MKINVYPADDGACGHYRIRWPAEYLAAQGADIEIIGAEQPEERQIMATMWHDPDGSHRAVTVQAPDADVVVIQRPLTDVLASSIPLLQEQGVVVVVEIDDDFEALHPRNASWERVHPSRSPRRNWRHLRAATDAADLVVCSTPALARRYGAHGRVAVVPNLVPAWYLGIERDPHDGVFVGWTGWLGTHPGDLEVTRGGVGRAITETGAQFAVVGDGKGVQRALGLASPPAAIGWVPLAEYPRAMAQFDVGIVPLDLTSFNQAKSALKMMEMAAVGVPVVASPTEENVRLHAAGIGDLAATPKQWGRKVAALADSAELRAEVAGRGREVMRGFTIEGHADRWWDAWSSAVAWRQVRRGLVNAG